MTALKPETSSTINGMKSSYDSLYSLCSHMADEYIDVGIDAGNVVMEASSMRLSKSTECNHFKQ